ncbi:hypothetical protein PAPYR_9709 [Paratrimastix pyriformis]|uniref:Uncharacterized protein n=1 Tax=Paratrimastix pyriformis TaxID=342808 RepID=A0ABQ8UBU9_9EUKA|nr:hypothetical protein PAPYR_9709 [Paratrimastix pyriformis]
MDCNVAGQIEGDILSRLPHDILLALVEASESATVAYIQLLSLSHALRARIIGRASELSFETTPDDPVTVPLESLTALVRPCEGLHRLSLVNQKISLFEDGTETECTSWVQETFTTHHAASLAVLRLPMGPLAHVLLCSDSARSLVDLTLEHGAASLTGLLPPLVPLSACCPRLQILRLVDWRCRPACPTEVVPPENFTRSLPTGLREFSLSTPPNDEAPRDSLAPFLQKCRCLERLTLPCVASGVEDVAPGLTHLDLHDQDAYGEDLAEMPFGRLASLRLTEYSHDIAGVLAANQATLRSLALIRWSWSDLVRGSHLIDPAIVSGLENLELSLGGPFGPTHWLLPLHLASGRLRRLWLADMSLTSLARLTLACPALEELALPQCSSSPMAYRLVVEEACPRLRHFWGPGCTNFQGWQPPCMGVLARDFLDHQPQLPHLAEVTNLWTDEPTMLARLLSPAPSLAPLTRLGLRLDAAHFANPLVLRLPDSLLRLDLAISHWAGNLDLDLQIEGPRLATLCLTGDVAGRHFHRAERVRVTLSCPALRSLHLGRLPRLVSFRFARPTPRLWGLRVDGCQDVAEPVALFLAAAESLRHLSLVWTEPDFTEPAEWPRLVAALSRLTRLTQLRLFPEFVPATCAEFASTPAGSPLVLSAPRLRRLVLHDRSAYDGLPVGRDDPDWDLPSPTTGKVVLGCPALERLELSGESRFLRSIGVTETTTDPAIGEALAAVRQKMRAES